MIHVLENDSDVPAGHLERVAAAHNIVLQPISLFDGDPLPEPGDVEAVIVLGGEMGAYDTESHHYLHDEKQFLAAVVELGKPTLGICLGCQLLADALGGSAYLAPEPELHIGPIDATEQDAAVATLSGGPSFSLHRDTWSLPPGGRLIGQTDGFNHVFRLGSALGVQSHPELTYDTLASWLATAEGSELAASVGSDTVTILNDFRDVADKCRDVADRFFDAWFDEVRATISSDRALPTLSP